VGTARHYCLGLASRVPAGLVWPVPSSVNDSFGMFGFTAAEVGDNLVQIVVMLFDVLVANTPYLFDNFIAVHV
jgi:hypothetical protein